MSSTRFPSRPQSSTVGNDRPAGRSDESTDDPLEYLGCCNCYRDLATHGTKPNRWKRTPVTFWILECGHVACAICLGYATGQPNARHDHRCPLPTCSSAKSAIHELRSDAPIHPSIASYLLPIDVMTNQLASGLAFQFEQMALRIQNLRRQMENQRKTLDSALPQLQSLRVIRNELAEMTQANHQLRLELDQMRTSSSAHRQSMVKKQSIPTGPEVPAQHARLHQSVNPSRTVKRRSSHGEALERPTQRIKRPQSSQANIKSGATHRLPPERANASFHRGNEYPLTDIVNVDDPPLRPPSVGLGAVQKGLKQYVFDPSRPPSRGAEHDSGSRRFKPPSLSAIPEREDSPMLRSKDVMGDHMGRSMELVEHPRALGHTAGLRAVNLQHEEPPVLTNQVMRPPTGQRTRSYGTTKAIRPLGIPPRSTPSNHTIEHPGPIPPTHHPISLPSLSRASNQSGFTYRSEPNDHTWNRDKPQGPSRYQPPPTPSRSQIPQTPSRYPQGPPFVPRFGAARGG